MIFYNILIKLNVVLYNSYFTFFNEKKIENHRLDYCPMTMQNATTPQATKIMKLVQF